LAVQAALGAVQHVTAPVADAARADNVPGQILPAIAAPSVEREGVQAEQLSGLLGGQGLVEVGTDLLHEHSGLPGFIVYDQRRTYLTMAKCLDLVTYALKALVNPKQPQDDVTGGYLHLTPERLRKPAQQVQDKLLRMAGDKPGAEVVAFPTAQAKEA
jgi:hypothetical protein